MSKFLVHFGAMGDVLVSLPVIEAFDQSHPGPFVGYGVSERLSLLLRPWGPLDALEDANSRQSVALFGDPKRGLEMLETGQWLVFGQTGTFAEKLQGRENVLLLPAPGQGVDGVLVKEHLKAFLPEHMQGRAPENPCLRVPSPGRSFFTLALGAGARNKRWDAKGFADLGRKIHQETGAQGKVILGPAELEQMDRGSLRRIFSESFFSFLEAVPLQELARCLAGSFLHVGNDSGPSHLAAALGTKTLTLFGPSVVEHWAPTGPLGLGSTVCAQSSEFRLLGVEQVWDEARKLV
ncbi:MAG: glycosyltransferase family 9 protein [Planctomycetota bacterium]|nr:glycosyltransferase family 9 protein [Planctomycetota bacterium]